jgi:DNA-binding response OmpR family regulator
MRILIAEDDAALAGFVRKGLEAEHYAVDVSADGEQARALASDCSVRFSKASVMVSCGSTAPKRSDGTSARSTTFS